MTAYSSRCVLITSVCVNFYLLLLFTTTCLFRLLKRYRRISVTGDHIKTISISVTDEIVNILLIGITVYCCLHLEWPYAYSMLTGRDSSDSDKHSPTLLLIVVCGNLGRYIIRFMYKLHLLITETRKSVKTLLELDEEKPKQQSQVVVIVNNLLVIGFLMAVLKSSHLWWLSVVAVFIEMNNIIINIRVVMSCVSSKHWLTVAPRYLVIEVISIIIFRMLLPPVLYTIYQLDKEKRSEVDIETAIIAVTIIYYSFYQFIYIRITLYTINVYKNQASTEYHHDNQMNLHIHNIAILTNNKGEELKSPSPGQVSFLTPYVKTPQLQLNKLYVEDETLRGFYNNCTKQEPYCIDSSRKAKLDVKTVRNDLMLSPADVNVHKHTCNVNMDKHDKQKVNKSLIK